MLHMGHYFSQAVMIWESMEAACWASRLLLPPDLLSIFDLGCLTPGLLTEEVVGVSRVVVHAWRLHPCWKTYFYNYNRVPEWYAFIIYFTLLLYRE